MPTAHVRLKPIEWFQEIGHYPKQGGEGRYLERFPAKLNRGFPIVRE